MLSSQQVRHSAPLSNVQPPTHQDTSPQTDGAYVEVNKSVSKSATSPASSDSRLVGRLAESSSLRSSSLGLRMKLKEASLTAHLAWSPKEVSPILMATGTAAQQLDASFSTASTLDVLSLGLESGSSSLATLSSTQTPHRFHKLVWGPSGIAEGGRSPPLGVIVGGCDQGWLNMYDAKKLVNGGDSDEAIIFSKEKHSGTVAGLDFNPFQSNLLASGGGESEVFIWDLLKLSSPMTPGSSKNSPLEEVRSLAWNRQVQHILATCFSSRCVVWDLRKNDPIIKVNPACDTSSSVSRARGRVVAWHPEVATQLCLASDEDHSPIIQVWDLRLASSPLKVLEGHHRGVLDVAWCQQDPDLLISCAKDSRILCWNPNENDPNNLVVGELVPSEQWSFDVSWCPRNPGVIAASSFDSKISVYSVMGGKQEKSGVKVSASIADSFPGMDQMAPVPTPQSSTQVAINTQLRNPPKWMKRPCGASFGFGGRLVTFGRHESQQQQLGAVANGSQVSISRVITETDMVARSSFLETSITNQSLVDFCDTKISEVKSTKDDQLWKFIKANFASEPRLDFLSLLAYDPIAVGVEIENATGIIVPTEDEGKEGDVINQLASLNTTEDKEGAFDAIAATQKEINSNLVTETRNKKSSVSLVTDLSSAEGLISKALLTGNLELAVEICLAKGRHADALILANKGGQALWERTQKSYFSSRTTDGAGDLIEGVSSGDWPSFFSRLEVASSWREALVAAITYASSENFAQLCSNLGDTLIKMGNNYEAAIICYICAGDLDRVVECWMKTRDLDGFKDTANGLQDLVEVVMSLKVALETQQQTSITLTTGGLMAQKLSEYATLLASQGELSAALGYLGTSDEETIVQLRNRLHGALGLKRATGSHHRHNESRLSADRRRSSSYTNPLNPSFSNFPASPYTAPQPSMPPPPSMPPSVAQPSMPPPMSQPSMPPPMAQPSVPMSSPSYMTPMLGGGGQLGGPSTPPSILDPNAQLVQPPTAQVQPRVMPDVTSTALKAPSTSFGYTPGWNDPPPLAASKTKPKETRQQTVEAITQPLMMTPDQVSQPPSTAMPNTAIPPMNNTTLNNSGMQFGYTAPNPQGPPPMSSSFVPSTTNFSPLDSVSMMEPSGMPASTPAAFAPPAPSTPSTYNIMQPSTPTTAAIPPPATNPVVTKERNPFPKEHIDIQEAFEGLRIKCLGAAHHPQTRRKLDDVGRKLELLYDKIRDNELSPSTLSSMHDLSSYLLSSDLSSALQLYTSIVSGSGFAEMAAFMPAVKTLMQISQQLQVGH